MDKGIFCDSLTVPVLLLERVSGEYEMQIDQASFSFGPRADRLADGLSAKHKTDSAADESEPIER